MIVVQSTGCAPIVKAFNDGVRHADLWRDAETVAPGMRVPVAIGDYLILDAVRASGGTAVAIDDDDLLAETFRFSAAEGVHVSPESGAALAAARRLREDGVLTDDDEVVVFATGSGLMHTELVPDEFPVLDPNASDNAAVVDAALSRR